MDNMKGKKVAIIVGGGPAPGINSVISAVTIEAINRGASVIGVYDGFSHLEKREKNIEFLTIPKVSRIHTAGGSIIRTSRANPTKSEEKLRNVVETLIDMEVNYIVTIGGDDTAFSSKTVSEYAQKCGYDIRSAHVPKTIDNDLPLPAGIPTFGYETARAEGARIISTIMEDAKTSGRWFIITAMGRKAGHLALGIGRSAGATLTLIPEEFAQKGITLQRVIDSIAGSIIKRRAYGSGYGVSIIAEGFFEYFKEDEIEKAIGKAVERDEHGHIRLAEINISEVIKNGVKAKLSKLGIKPPTIIDQKLGYELRCIGPCPYDIEYTRNLGYAAVDFLANGGSSALMSIQYDQITPIKFEDMADPATGRTKVRLVDTNSLSFKIAGEYMIRLKKSDFTNEENLTLLAKTAGIPNEEFRKEFEDCVL